MHTSFLWMRVCRLDRWNGLAALRI
jgi:hypothetical protein